jgi:4-diphosphocytidyl-2-C-methyl-D-erythritol kinase
MDVVEERAHAKLNLTLEVTGRRDDGYHSLKSVMQTVDLYDTVRCHVTAGSTVTLSCSERELENESNTVYRAAIELQSLAVEKGWRRRECLGAEIHVEKQIPVAAGLAGGSSCAAATLRALNRLWKFDLSADELVNVGLRVGSDVPFLLYEGTALVEGRGEKVTQLPPAIIPGSVAIVVPSWIPDGQCEALSKTGTLFKLITPSHYSTCSVSHLLSKKVTNKEMVVNEDLTNVFMAVISRAFPEWESLHSKLEEGCQRRFSLSGAGPAMFTLDCNETTLAHVAKIVDRAEIPANVFLCRPSYTIR